MLFVTGPGAVGASLVRNRGLSCPAPVVFSGHLFNALLAFFATSGLLSEPLPLNPCDPHNRPTHTGTSASASNSQCAKRGTFIHPRSATPLLPPPTSPPSSSSTPNKHTIIQHALPHTPSMHAYKQHLYGPRRSSLRAPFCTPAPAALACVLPANLAQPIILSHPRALSF